MRIGEFLLLPVNCIHHLSDQQWALHVPVGKLHTDRWVPADPDILHFHARLLALRPSRAAATPAEFLFRQPLGHLAAYHHLHRTLRLTARHQRHTHHQSDRRLNHQLPPRTSREKQELRRFF